MPSTSDFTKSVIALVCWRAASTELHSVMLAVCQVFMNRAAAGWYSSDLYENCWRWLHENPGEYPDVRDPQFQQLLSKIDAVILGLVPDRTGGALYFVSKADFENEIYTLARGSAITTTIGNTIFVK